MSEDTKVTPVPAPETVTVMLLRTAGTSQAGDILRDDHGASPPAAPHERATFVQWPLDGGMRARLNDAVGGYAKALTLYDLRAHPIEVHGVLWINSEPTSTPQVNSRATRIAKTCGAHQWGGRILGDAVFSGPPSATSEVTSVPGQGG